MTTTLADVPQLVIKPRRALPFFSRHPWVFTSALERTESEPADGQEVVLRSHDGQFIGRGLFNSNSQLRVRL
jgi:23S rRNA (cytosine1962-C5)-methyltransferase